VSEPFEWTEKIVSNRWLLAFVGLYWAYCLFWGFKGAQRSKTTTDYFVAGRSIGVWVFVLAATATSFSGWTFIGHPGKIFTDGLPYAFASFYALTIPFTGVLFLRRQWVLGRAFKYITPGEMYSDYYGGNAIRLLTVLVAFLFSVPYLGVQLRASGALFNILTDGWIPVNVGMFALSAIVMIYVASGGLRSVAYVDCAQCILLALGIVILGLIAIHFAGGWGGFTTGLANHVQEALDLKQKITPSGQSHVVAMPGVIQPVSEAKLAVGGVWTGVMCLTYMFALMGIQSSPAFSMWAYSNRTSKPFRWQQVVASSLIIGIILFTFTTFQGLGGNVLAAEGGALRELKTDIDLRSQHALNEHALTESKISDDLREKFESGKVTLAANAKISIKEPGTQWKIKSGDNAYLVVKDKDRLNIYEVPSEKNLVPKLINLMTDTAPWLVGFLAVCALAAMQSTGAAYMSTFSGMVTRDLFHRYISPNATDAAQKLCGRIFVIVVTVAALLVAANSKQAIVMLGGLAVAYGFQMYPALMGVCYFPKITRRGVVWGLVAGLIAVTLTDKTVEILNLPWGKFPLTIHSAGWGILANLLVTLGFSLLLPERDEHKQAKLKRHHFLQAVSGVPENRRKHVGLAWVLTVVWFLVGFGPAAIIGNTLFSDPNVPFDQQGHSTWTLGLPSIWIWQLLMLVFGIFVMWFLAFHIGLSKPIPIEQVDQVHAEHFPQQIPQQADGDA